MNLLEDGRRAVFIGLRISNIEATEMVILELYNLIESIIESQPYPQIYRFQNAVD